MLKPLAAPAAATPALIPSLPSFWNRRHESRMPPIGLDASSLTLALIRTSFAIGLRLSEVRVEHGPHLEQGVGVLGQEDAEGVAGIEGQEPVEELGLPERRRLLAADRAEPEDLTGKGSGTSATAFLHAIAVAMRSEGSTGPAQSIGAAAVSSAAWSERNHSGVLSLESRSSHSAR